MRAGQPTDPLPETRSEPLPRDDVVRLTFYVTGWTPDKIDGFMAGIEQVAAEIGLAVPMPPASLIGVEYLFEPDVLVEVEATAVCD